jgi:ribosomal protein S18 acetylase RimI-like enzyme
VAEERLTASREVAMIDPVRDDAHALAGLVVRPYRSSDERGWLRCSVLAFLDTAYFDSVFRRKPQYEQPAIELVAELDGVIAGVIDVECEETPGTVCTSWGGEDGTARGGMIWHLAVHPDLQRRGIGGLLLQEARRRAAERGISCLEAWTRDDEPTLRWYRSQGFVWISSYLHVYMESRAETREALDSRISGLAPVRVFAHYTGDDREAMRQRFARVHECSCFRLTW